MSSHLADTFERNARAVALRPSVGQGTAITRARLGDGLACEIEDGRWRFSVDLSKRTGGGGEAPDPGVYGRGALAACLTSTYALYAARHGVALDALEVEVFADYDSRGMYGVDGVPADYVSLRYSVTVRSPAADDAIEAMMRDAEEHCIYLNVFQRPHELRREVRIER